MGARQRKAAKNISLYNTYPFPPTQNIQPKAFVQSGVYESKMKNLLDVLEHLYSEDLEYLFHIPLCRLES